MLDALAAKLTSERALVCWGWLAVVWYAGLSLEQLACGTLTVITFIVGKTIRPTGGGQ
jgi:hypothetical protein